MPKIANTLDTEGGKSGERISSEVDVASGEVDRASGKVFSGPDMLEPQQHKTTDEYNSELLERVSDINGQLAYIENNTNIFLYHLRQNPTMLQEMRETQSQAMQLTGLLTRISDFIDGTSQDFKLSRDQLLQIGMNERDINNMMTGRGNSMILRKGMLSEKDNEELYFLVSKSLDAASQASTVLHRIVDHVNITSADTPGVDDNQIDAIVSDDHKNYLQEFLVKCQSIIETLVNGLKSIVLDLVERSKSFFVQHEHKSFVERLNAQEIASGGMTK